MNIKDIEPIESCSVRIRNRDEIPELVELPCLEACYALYDKNIFTYWSSANNDKPIAEIGIRMSCLDEVNTAHAEKLIASGVAERLENAWGLGKNEVGLSISFPIDETDTVEDISARLVNLVESFEPQDVLYGRTDIAEAQELASKIIGSKVNATEARNILECLGYFIDEDEGIIWDSMELAEKHKSYLAEIDCRPKPIK